jgi:hypothetical protein
MPILIGSVVCACNEKQHTTYNSSVNNRLINDRPSCDTEVVSQIIAGHYDLSIDMAHNKGEYPKNNC